MQIYLEERKKDLSAFKKAIKYCKGDSKTTAVLNKYFERIYEEYQYADFIKNEFIPLVENKVNFHSAFIFCTENGDFRVDIFVHNANEDIKREYRDIYDKFCKKNDGTFFHFFIYDIEKDKNEYNEAREYDKIIIKPKKMMGCD